MCVMKRWMESAATSWKEVEGDKYVTANKKSADKMWCCLVSCVLSKKGWGSVSLVLWLFIQKIYDENQ